MNECFELSLLGGAVERRFRELRPATTELPWGTLALGDYPRAAIESARRRWTLAAFQEQRSAAATAETLRALLAARAPLDLVAMASRFVLDEVAHVELCARVAMELGGAVALHYDPHRLIHRGGSERPVLYEAAELIVRNYCIEEAFSAPMLKATLRVCDTPLIAAVLGELVRDEAAHAQLGWIFLDWAVERLSDEDRTRLAGVARRMLDRLARSWPEPGSDPDHVDALGGLGSARYLELARRTVAEQLVAPLRAHGIDVPD